MKIGTRSVLFGVHQFLIHPLFVALAWWRLYGFPNDVRLWFAFFVHDLGYWGKPNMDGKEGETHPILGARIMGAFFGPSWYEFCLYHSRFYAKRDRHHFTQLCVADKLANCLYPTWLYLLLANLSGEIREYMDIAHSREGGKYANEMREAQSQRAWLASIKRYMLAWVETHQDMREDTWTRPATHQ